MSRLRDDIEQLTARLTTAVDAKPDRPSVCVLLMGHLPVRAGLWRLPAARRLLPDCEQILVVRCEGEEVFLECIGRFDMVLSDTPDLFDQLPSKTTVVIVPESSTTADDIKAFDPDSIALVTAGDQAATAGAYRMLKSMDLPDGQVVDLVIAGSEGVSVEETASRLQETVSRHLELTMNLKGEIPRIEADTGLTQSTVMKLPEGGLQAIVRRVRRGIRQTSSARTASDRLMSSGDLDQASAMSSLPASMPLEVEQDIPSSHDEEPCARLSPVAPVPQWSSAAPQAVTMAEEDERHPEKRTPRSAAEDHVSDAAAELCAHVPGLRKLPVQCPDHEAIELAIDETGSLHLVTRCEDVLHVPAVLAWIVRHHTLLEMALPDTCFGQTAEPAVHVLSEDLDVLCGLRHSSWQPHLLVRVDQQGPAGWTSVPLGSD
ncbi:MAG: hypothetical protein CMJ29_08445 [Phycisphaerae bacterium]|nr:hypothetical protein [Phycisphaerae bacterium]|tara:strand:- start:3549 stop:4841 length:1293 start_codon:yes stop_codon:yes gene_type:complete